MASSQINVDNLKHMMALRGLNGADLAALAKLSSATVSTALQGRLVANRTLRQIAAALHAVPVDPEAEALLADGGMAESG